MSWGRITAFVLSIVSLSLVSLAGAQPARNDARAVRLDPARLAALRDANQFSKYHVLKNGAIQPVERNFTAHLAAGEMIVSRTSAAPILVRTSAGAAEAVLPLRIDINDQGGQQVTVFPWLSFEGGGLHWSAERNAYSGTVLVGLVLAGAAAAGRQLSGPVLVQLTGDASEYVPDSVSVDHTNAPYRKISISARAATDSIQVTAYAASSPEAVHIMVPVSRQELTVTPTPQKIQGFGLEVAHLVVIGPPPVGGRPSEVNLTSDLATPEPQILKLDDAGRGVATLRSRGLGTAKLRAVMPSLAPSETTVEFLAPWAYFWASVLGGLVGAVIRLLGSATGRAAKKLSPRILTFLLLGILIGLVVVAAYTVGVNLLQVSPDARAGEALVFVLAALGAILGPAVFKPMRTLLAGP